MSRLLKKCLFLSIGMHILLAAVLIFCTALSGPEPDNKIMPTFSMIAPDVLDNLLKPQRVSTPKTAPNPPVRRIVIPTPPKKVTPTPPKKVRPTPPKKVRPTPPKKVTPTPPKKVRPTPPKNKIIKIAKNTQTAKGTPTRPKNNQPKVPSISAKEVKIIKNMRGQLSGAINVDVTGANKAAFTSYASFVVSVYRRTWEPLIPDGLARERIAKVSVTIRSDGHVLSAKIIRKTGDAALDRSVQRALDRVKTIGERFPSGSKDSLRTFTLDFTPRIRGRN
jgi:TonB family protein